MRTILTVLAVSMVSGSIHAGPPLTNKERTDAAIDCVITWIDKINKEAKANRIKPVVQSVNDQLKRGSPRVIVLLADRGKGRFQVEAQCMVINESMAIVQAAIWKQVYPIQAHKTRFAAVEDIGGIINAVAKTSGDTEKIVLSEWEKNGEAIAKVGMPWKTDIGKIQFKGIPDMRRVGFALIVDPSTLPRIPRR